MAGGVLFCRTCATQIQGTRPSETPESRPFDPRARTIASWISAIAFVVMGLTSLNSMATGPAKITTPPAGMAVVLLLYAWMGWSVAWTLPPIVNWLHARWVRPLVASVRMAQPGCLLSGLFALFTLLILWYFLCAPAFAVAMIYGLFGGGVREMLRFRREWVESSQIPENVAGQGAVSMAATSSGGSPESNLKEDS